MTPNYALSAAAETDLREIIRYTRKQWSDAQARAYVTKLRRGIENVSGGQGPFKDMTALYPGLRMIHCEHHFIFCLPHKTAPALVVAILHERMDLMARVADRLK